MNFRITVVVALTAALASCTTDQMTRNVYEGVRANNAAVKPAPPEQAPQRPADYEVYERERKALGNRPGQ